MDESSNNHQASQLAAQQTMPKSIEQSKVVHPDSSAPKTDNSQDNNPAKEDEMQVRVRDARCIINQDDRKSSITTPTNGSSGQQSQLMASLVAKRRLLPKITIEPLAFIAILALYIEFPSIQDLIYTKICLQVVANHPNLTLHQSHQPLPMPSNDSTSMPPSEGRIANQLNDTSMSSMVNQSQIVSFNSTQVEWRRNDLILCDRLNKTAIPSSVRQEINDENSAFWLRYQVLVTFLCVISCPYWGGLSDRIGRLIPLNVPVITSIITNAISLALGLLISLDQHAQVPIEVLYLGALLIGLSGGQAIVIVNSFSFISDNSSNESRSKRVTILESVIYLSHSFGFLTARYIMSLDLATSDRPWLNRHLVSFSLIIILNAVCVLYSILRLRHFNFHRFLNNFEREQHETFSSEATLGTGSLRRSDGRLETLDHCPRPNVSDRSRELTASTPDDLDGPVVRSDRHWTNWGSLWTLKYYRETYETATKKRETRTMILLLLLCGFISAMSLASTMSLLYIYLRMDPINWTTSQYSTWNTITSFTRGAALVALTFCMRFAKSYNIPDPLVAAIGFLSKGASLWMIAMAQSSLLIDWSLLTFVFSEYSMPPIRSLLSKLVVKEEVGKIYSCLAAIQSICFLVGNLVFYLAYNTLELRGFYRLSFIVVGCFEYLAVFIMLYIYTNLRNRVMIL